MKNITTLFAFVCLLFVSQSAYAANTATALTGETIESIATEDGSYLSPKATKKQARLEKRIAKMQKKAAAQDVDFNDDTQKWMWFWIFSWILALIFPIIGIITGGLGGAILLSALAGLLALSGTVSLVIWLVKKFA